MGIVIESKFQYTVTESWLSVVVECKGICAIIYRFLNGSRMCRLFAKRSGPALLAIDKEKNQKSFTFFFLPLFTVPVVTKLFLTLFL